MRFAAICAFPCVYPCGIPCAILRACESLRDRAKRESLACVWETRCYSRLGIIQAGHIAQGIGEETSQDNFDTPGSVYNVTLCGNLIFKTSTSRVVY